MWPKSPPEPCSWIVHACPLSCHACLDGWKAVLSVAVWDASRVRATSWCGSGRKERLLVSLRYAREWGDMTLST